MELLLLATPTQHSANNPIVELNVRQLKKWIYKLPFDDVALSINSLGKAIKPFNELILSDSQRLKLLEVYYEALTNMICSVDGLISDQESVDKFALIAEDVVWVFLELANGYKIIVKNSQLDGQDPSSEIVQLAIYRGMELLSLSLMSAWGSKIDIPPLARLEFNQLYLFVCNHKLNTTKIKLIKKESDNASIDRLFVQFGLLSIGSPFASTFNNIYQLFGLFESFAKYCKIGRQLDGGYHYKYKVDLMEDSCFSSVENQEEIANLKDNEYLIDIEKAVEAMSTWKDNQKDFQNSLFLENELELIRHYLEIVTITKHEAELPDNNQDIIEFIQQDEVKLAFGLDTLKFILENNLYMDNQETIPLSHWTIEKKNQKGYLLSGTLSPVMDEPNIGDVTAIYDSVNSTMGIHYPTIGIIRSIQYNNDTELSLGLEVVSGKPLPITCFSVDPENECFQEYVGLYFPSNRELNHPATVLAEKNLHDQGCTFLVYIKSRAFAIKPRKQLIESPILTCFSFKVLKD